MRTDTYDRNKLPVDLLFETMGHLFIQDLKTEAPVCAKLGQTITIYSVPICTADATCTESFKERMGAVKESMIDNILKIRAAFDQLTAEKVEWTNEYHPEHNPDGFVGRWKYSARLYSILSVHQVESLEAVS